jgi:hypothetical protein
MTQSTVYSLFVNRAKAISADIVKRRDEIICECVDLAQVIKDAHANAEGGKAGTDAIREAIFDDGHFTWLYDSTGKPNKKGAAKPTMGSLMRKIREGMLYLAEDENKANFYAWTESEGAKKSGVCDFSNIKKVITPKKEKAAPAESGDGESENEPVEPTTDKRTPAEFLAWVYKQAMTEFGMDPIAFAEFAESAEGMKVADQFTKAA